MKDKLIQVRADEELLSHIAYLKGIYGLNTLSALIRFIINKEYRKENQGCQETGNCKALQTSNRRKTDSEPNCLSCMYYESDIYGKHGECGMAGGLVGKDCICSQYKFIKL